MKTVQLREVAKYENSDKWYSEEVSGKLLMTTITFLSFDREFIKVSKIKYKAEKKRKKKSSPVN